jgi:transposase
VVQEVQVDGQQVVRAAQVTARSWLTVFQLPAYAPELNPVEGVWSSLKRSLANLTKHGA